MGAKVEHKWRGKLNELPRHPTPEMIEAGGRSIGNTIRWENHQDRSNACWTAMAAAYFDGIEEAWPTQPCSKGPNDNN